MTTEASFNTKNIQKECKILLKDNALTFITSIISTVAFSAFFILSCYALSKYYSLSKMKGMHKLQAILKIVTISIPISAISTISFSTFTFIALYTSLEGLKKCFYKKTKNISKEVKSSQNKSKNCKKILEFLPIPLIIATATFIQLIAAFAIFLIISKIFYNYKIKIKKAHRIFIFAIATTFGIAANMISFNILYIPLKTIIAISKDKQIAENN